MTGSELERSIWLQYVKSFTILCGVTLTIIHTRYELKSAGDRSVVVAVVRAVLSRPLRGCNEFPGSKKRIMQKSQFSRYLCGTLKSGTSTPRRYTYTCQALFHGRPCLQSFVTEVVRLKECLLLVGEPFSRRLLTRKQTSGCPLKT